MEILSVPDLVLRFKFSNVDILDIRGEGLGDDYFREAIILNSVKGERLFEGGD